MNYRRKLKSSNNVYIYLPLIFSLTVFFGVLLIFGKAIALYTLGVIMLAYAIMTLIPYSRTKNKGFLLTSISLRECFNKSLS